MVLVYERHAREQEIIMEGKCMETRQAMGLPLPIGLEECEFEPCFQSCKCRGEPNLADIMIAVGDFCDLVLNETRRMGDFDRKHAQA